MLATAALRPLTSKDIDSRRFALVTEEEWRGGDPHGVLVIGAGPASFGFVKTLVESRSLRSDPARPPVLVLECGESPGIRSVYGGAFWPDDPTIFPEDPDFFSDCPRERTIPRHQDQLQVLGPRGERFHIPGLDPSILLRNRTPGLMTPKSSLYPWMWNRLESRKAEGAFRIRFGTTVDKLLLDTSGRVAGVQTTSGQRMFARVVVDGSGAGALFSRDLAVRPLTNDAKDFFFGVKLVANLPSQVILDRFGLKDDGEGCVREFVGGFSSRIPHLPGMVAVYPGRKSIHISVLYDTSWGASQNLSPHEVFNECISHPVLRDLLDGAEPVEWSACRLPELHFRHMPTWSHPGYLPLGDALGLVDFLRKHGVNTAMASGRLGALLVGKGIQAGESILDTGTWRRDLEESWIAGRLDGWMFRRAHSLLSEPRTFALASKVGSLLGRRVRTDSRGIAPRPLSDWIGLNAEPEGQPEIVVLDPSRCLSCASEACRLSDPCPAVATDASGVPVLDRAPAEREEWNRLRGAGNRWRMVDSLGCLECGNCESACPWGNLLFLPPNNLPGKDGHRNRGIRYRFN
ncbi:MAG: hypothetical protein H6686_05640 [Fibrobacteria bacterium]|nr:hypothetical protein [Fibrobacteria bacterium]